MKILRLSLILFILLLANSLKADQKFDCGFVIESVDGAIREASLTEEVYGCLLKSSYRDLQVINGDGNRVPFVIEHPVSEAEILDFEKELKFNEDTVDPGLDRHNKLRRLIRSRSYWNDSNGFDDWNRKHSYLNVLILENPETTAKINRLNFEITNKSGLSLSATVIMEYSVDLIRWTSSSNPQKLFFQHNHDQGFNKNQLVLGANKNRRYIRLAVLSNSDRFVESIINIKGQYQKTEKTKPDFFWTEPASIQQLSNGQDWQFSVPAQLPVSQMRFAPGGDIVYYSGLLMQKPIENEVAEDNAYLGLREGKKNQLKKALKNIVTGNRRSFESINSGWKSVKRFHQYQFDEATISAEPIYFFHRPSRHWRIKFDQPTAEMIASYFPQVEFGWTPARIRFLAQGPEPFQIQAGSKDHIPRLATPAVLRSGENTVSTTLTVSDSHKLPADTNVNDPLKEHSDTPDDNASDNQWMIWLVLIIGVAVMGFMAWQLLGSIQKQNNSDQQE